MKFIVKWSWLFLLAILLVPQELSWWHYIWIAVFGTMMGIRDHLHPDKDNDNVSP